MKTDGMLKKELNPIANMMPYLTAGWNPEANNESLTAFTITRPRGIPQSEKATDAAAMTVLFIDAHCQVGVEGAKAITPRVLPDAAKQLA
ncbi:unnamed protein product, partial [Eruca vesicaria subsp. sativa]|nr:unnamed protein product [Eruca vesicaria subsp. sativa]